MRPAVFLDRDGTIIADKNYLSKVEEIEFLPGAVEAVKILNKNNYYVILVTNQSGIARGYFSINTAEKIKKYFLAQLKNAGANIDKYYYCPHYPEGSGKYNIACDCRKPKIGMFNTAINELAIDKIKSWVIGDKKSDLEFGINAGIKPILVNTGYGKSVKYKNAVRKKDLLDAVKYILYEDGKKDTF